MDHMREYFNVIVAAVGVGISTVLGGWDLSLQILLTVVVIDYITGLVKSGYKGNLSSSIGWKGLLRKGAIFFVIIVAHQMDMITGNEMPLFRIAAAYFYIANEAISITENISELGIPLPNFLISSLEAFKKNTEDNALGNSKYNGESQIRKDVR